MIPSSVGLDVMRKIQKLKNQHTVIIITHFCYIHSDICNLYFLFWMICWQKNKNYRAFVTPKIPRRAMWCVCVFFFWRCYRHPHLQSTTTAWPQDANFFLVCNLKFIKSIIVPQDANFFLICNLKVHHGHHRPHPRRCHHLRRLLVGSVSTRWGRKFPRFLCASPWSRLRRLHHWIATILLRP